MVELPRVNGLGKVLRVVLHPNVCFNTETADGQQEQETRRRWVNGGINCELQRVSLGVAGSAGGQMAKDEWFRASLSAVLKRCALLPTRVTSAAARTSHVEEAHHHLPDTGVATEPPLRVISIPW